MCMAIPGGPLHASQRQAGPTHARDHALQGVVELWGEGETLEELQAAIEAFPQERKAPWLGAGCSMKVAKVACSCGRPARMPSRLR